MKKDFISSIRMNSRIRDALRRAANRERRTVASLLDKIIIDYLENEGFVGSREIGSDRRRHQRKSVCFPAKSVLDINDTNSCEDCVVLNLSEGGLLVSYPKGSEIDKKCINDLSCFVVSLNIPHNSENYNFKCCAKRFNYNSNTIEIGAKFLSNENTNINKLISYISD